MCSTAMAMPLSMEPPKPACHSYYRKFKPGEYINSQAKQVILNVFFHISSSNPQKSWKLVANEASALTGVSAKTIFTLKTEKQKSILQEKRSCDSPPHCDVNPENPELLSRTGCTDHMVSLNTIPGVEVYGVPNQTQPPKKKRKEKGSESPRSRKRKFNSKPKTRKDRYGEATLSAIRYKLEEISHRIEAPTVNKFLEEVNADPNLPNFKRTTFHNILQDMGFSRFLKKPRGLKAAAMNAKKNVVGTVPIKDPVGFSVPWNE